MITDKKHLELRNLFTPIVNYFCILKELDEHENMEIEKFSKLLQILHDEQKIIYEVISKIRKILNEDKNSERSEEN